jgi:hypothetical protein
MLGNGSNELQSGPLSFFSADPSQNPDMQFLNKIDEEAIQVGGSPIHYHEVFIQEGTMDPLYREDRGKLFSPIPVQLYAFYEPIGSSRAQGIFGIDSAMDEVMFECNYSAVLKLLGHPPKVGSLIHTPHLGENWVIIECKTAEFKMWGRFRIHIHCARFQESVTTGEGKMAQNNTKVNHI